MIDLDQGTETSLPLFPLFNKGDNNSKHLIGLTQELKNMRLAVFKSLWHIIIT